MAIKLSDLLENFAIIMRESTKVSYVVDFDVPWPSGRSILGSSIYPKYIAAAFDSHYSALAQATLDVCATYMSAIPKDCRNIILSYFSRTIHHSSGWGGIGADFYESTFMGVLHSDGDNAAEYQIIENELRSAKWCVCGRLYRAAAPCMIAYDLSAITLSYSHDPVPASPHIAPYVIYRGKELYIATYRPPTDFAKMKAYPPAIRDPFILVESQILAFESRRCGHPMPCWRSE